MIAAVPTYSREALALYQSAQGTASSIDNAHLRLTRLNGAVARDVAFSIAPGQDSLVIDMVVPITGSQELLMALLELRQGDQVLFSGTALVLAIAGGGPQVPLIPMVYVGPVAAVVSQLVLVANGTLGGIVGQLLAQPVVVQALTADGTPVAGVPVAWSVLSGGAQLGQTSSVTDASGLARVPVTLGAAVGVQTVQAAANGVAPLVISLTAVAAQAAQLVILRQPSLEALLGVVLPTQPAVRLADQYGNAVSATGVPVLAAPTGVGFLLGGPTTAQTDAHGVATFTGLFLSGLVGSTALHFTSGQLTPVTSTPITLAALPLPLSPAPEPVPPPNDTAVLPVPLPLPADSGPLPVPLPLRPLPLPPPLPPRPIPATLPLRVPPAPLWLAKRVWHSGQPLLQD